MDTTHRSIACPTPTRHFSRLSLCSVCVRRSTHGYPPISSIPSHPFTLPLLLLHCSALNPFLLWFCFVARNIFFFSAYAVAPQMLSSSSLFPISFFFFFSPFTFTAYKHSCILLHVPITTYLGSCFLFIHPSLSDGFSSSSLSFLPLFLLLIPLSLFIFHSSSTVRYTEQSTSESGVWSF